MNADEITITLTEDEFQNLTDGAYALMTAPFVLFLVAIIIGAVFVMTTKRQ